MCYKHRGSDKFYLKWFPSKTKPQKAWCLLNDICCIVKYIPDKREFLSWLAICLRFHASEGLVGEMVPLLWVSSVVHWSMLGWVVTAQCRMTSLCCYQQRQQMISTRVSHLPGSSLGFFFMGQSHFQEPWESTSSKALAVFKSTCVSDWHHTGLTNPFWYLSSTLLLSKAVLPEP